MKNTSAKNQWFSVLTRLTTAVTLISGLLFVAPSSASAATYTSGAASLSTPAISAASTTYTFTLGGVTLSAIKCMQVQFTTAIGTTSKPTGMTVTGATFSGTSNYVPTPASWSPANNNTDGTVKITYATGETPASAAGRTIVLGGITNGSSAGTTYYATVSTFNNVDCATSPIDSGSVAFAFSQGVNVTATVNPTLTFTVSSTSCALSTLSASAPTSCSHTIAAGTNAASGYTISYLAASTLTSLGTNTPTITAIGATAAASSTGNEQFGINLKANTTPSVGADPSGGTGAALTNYGTANSFAFNTAGANIASVAAPSATTTFTVSYVANIASNTEAGNYATTITYNVIANY